MKNLLTLTLVFIVSNCFAQQEKYQTVAEVELTQKVDFESLPDTVKKLAVKMYDQLNEMMKPEYRKKYDGNLLQVYKITLKVDMIDSTSTQYHVTSATVYSTNDWFTDSAGKYNHGPSYYVYATTRTVGYAYMIGIFETNGVNDLITYVSLKNTFKVENDPEGRFKKIDSLNAISKPILFESATFAITTTCKDSGYIGQNYMLTIPPIVLNKP